MCTCIQKLVHFILRYGMISVLWILLWHKPILLSKTAQPSRLEGYILFVTATNHWASSVAFIIGPFVEINHLATVYIKQDKLTCTVLLSHSYILFWCCGLSESAASPIMEEVRGACDNRQGKCAPCCGRSHVTAFHLNARVTHQGSGKSHYSKSVINTSSLAFKYLKNYFPIFIHRSWSSALSVRLGIISMNQLVRIFAFLKHSCIRAQQQSLSMAFKLKYENFFFFKHYFTPRTAIVCLFIPASIMGFISLLPVFSFYPSNPFLWYLSFYNHVKMFWDILPKNSQHSKTLW